MNFSIIKTGLVAVAAMVSLSSFSQDLIARQAPIDKKLKSVDSLALQKQIRAEQSEYPALSLSPLFQQRINYFLNLLFCIGWRKIRAYLLCRKSYLCFCFLFLQ